VVGGERSTMRRFAAGRALLVVGLMIGVAACGSDSSADARLEEAAEPLMEPIRPFTATVVTETTEGVTTTMEIDYHGPLDWTTEIVSAEGSEEAAPTVGRRQVMSGSSYKEIEPDLGEGGAASGDHVVVDETVHAPDKRIPHPLLLFYDMDDALGISPAEVLDQFGAELDGDVLTFTSNGDDFTYTTTGLPKTYVSRVDGEVVATANVVDFEYATNG
jgi:ABC-type glycerol-3-phosphate transport system substrate-binding protein